MHTIFYFIFAATIIYEEIKKRQGDLLIHMIMSMMRNSEKSSGDGLSVAARSASKTFLFKYMHGESEYELVLPMSRKKKLAWDKCVAHFRNGEKKDVTNAAVYRAGPLGDFFGLVEKLKPFQVVTGSDYLEFFNQEKLVLTIGELPKVELGEMIEVKEKEEIEQPKVEGNAIFF